MKRHGNLFERIISVENLLLAYKRASRGKQSTVNVQRFALDVPGNIELIRNSLQQKTFSTSRYQSKIIHEPKTREIFVLPFAPDRIVQHAIMAIIAPIWDRLMISDSFSCRVGKGQHAGSRRAMEFVRRYRYCLKCDIAKFYPSMDQQVLSSIVRKKIKCHDTLWLLDDIIFSYHGGKNIPIGNYTSQWFGNLYLNELDHLVKHDLGFKGYLRYCDDFCLFSDEKSLLQRAKETICKFIKSNLKLQFSFAEVFPVSHGVDFLGYRHFKKHILLRKSTATRVKRRLAKMPQKIGAGMLTTEQVRSSLASTKGWLQWANTHNLTVSTKLKELEDTYVSGKAVC